MKPEKEQEPIVQTKSPEIEALLEHNLVKGHEDAQETHSLLEHHLVKSHEHDQKTEQQADNHLEMLGKIHDKMADSVHINKAEMENGHTFIVKAQKGDQGDKGEIGEKGERGDQGEVGPQGPQGEKGEASTVQGPQGEQGPEGKPGRDGKDGADGKDGRDGKDGKDGKDGSPDDGDTIITKLTGKLSYSHLKDAPEFPKMAGTGYLREISDVDTTGLQDGQTLVWHAASSKWKAGTASGVTPQVYDLSPYLDGSTKSFTFPANTKIYLITSDSAPFTFRPGVDFTGSGTTTLTFASGIDAPSMLAAGHSIIANYY